MAISTRKTAENWCAAGEEYFKKKEYLQAKTCHEKAILLDAQYLPSLYRLGYIYEYGFGITKNLIQAKAFYEKSAAVGSQLSKKRLIIIEHADNDTSQQWYNTALSYYKKKEYDKSKICFQLTIENDSKNSNANYWLGWMYAHGQGGEVDLSKSKKHYEIAAEKGDVRSQKQLFILQNNTKAILELNNTGDNFLNKKNYTSARWCYEIVYSKNSKNLHALYSLGSLYENGHGVIKNIETAKEFYEKAAKLGGIKSKKRLLILNNPTLQTADEWCNLGDRYFYETDYTLSKICYELSLDKNKNHDNALYGLGYLYEFGCGVDINLLEARKFYQKSLIREHIKRIERKIIEEAVANGEDLSLVDEEKNTAFHRAALLPSFKTYARLLCLGAVPTLPDKKGQIPDSYLNKSSINKIHRLRNDLSELLTGFKATAPEIIVEKIILKNGGRLNKEKSLATLTRLYSIPEIKPLFDLVKLAMMGRHRISNRTSVIDDEYDSDDEEAITTDKIFHIYIDSESATVENLLVTSSKDANGIYWATSSTHNSIYVGGARESNLAIGTVIHEMCHFAIEEMEYVIDKAKLNDLLNAMKIKTDLDPLFKEIFNYSLHEQYEELIARTAEYIALRFESIASLKKTEPDLLNYYRNHFLSSIEKHVIRLEKKALGGWSPKVFKSSSDKIFSLEDKKAESLNLSSLYKLKRKFF